jgi:hypothetical protein
MGAGTVTVRVSQVEAVMNPSLALFFTILVIFYLFKQDLKQQSNVSQALWIPWLWMVILGSRYVSQWLNLGAPAQVSVDSIEDGSPIDRIVFFLLLATAVYILRKRHISWSLLFQNNIALTLFLGYCAVSILWSDFPLIAFKRWIKILGHPLMVLLLFTERDPVKAVETVIKRCAYILVPLSILFIKYYPNIGRGYDRWTYQPILVGVTDNKNTLGYICMVFALFFACKLLALFGNGSGPGKMMEKIVIIGFFSITVWLLQIAHSGTSLVCFIIGMCIVIILKFTSVKKHLGFCICISIFVFLILQLTFNITESIILSLGKDLTLTGRNEVWTDVLEMKTDPLIGTGFESFWLGKRLEAMWEKHWWQPNQAHNGYIETYINLGFLGLFFLCGIILSSFRNIRKILMLPNELPCSKLRSILNGRERSKSRGIISSETELARGKTPDFDFIGFRIGYLIAFMIYNLTEAAFKGLHLLFFIFFIITVEYTHVKSETSVSNTASLPKSTRKQYNISQKLDKALR